MSWAARFQLRQHFRQSLWAVPLLGAIAGAALAVIDLGVEARVTMPASWSYSPSTASSVLTTVSGAMIGLLGLVVTVGVLVVQMATGTLSPRFMRLWYRDRLQKLVLAAFTATFAFSFALLGTVEAGSVPDLGVTMAGLAVAVDLVLLLLYLDRFVHALRPVAVAAAVARSGRAVVAEVDHAGIDLQAGDRGLREVQGRKVQVRSSKSGAIQAMDARGMVDLATRHDLTCVLTCSVGDFVNAGAVVMDVYGSPDRRVLRRLRGKIALGHERTIDQDPAYAVRIIVDIAIRALSPAVNDPTTATQMINYLGAVLTDVGARELGRYGTLFDADGHLQARLSHAHLGGLPPPRCLGDSTVRARFSPGVPTPEGDARRPRGHRPARQSARGPTRARGAGPDRTALLRGGRRPGVRARTGPAGNRRGLPGAARGPCR